MIIVLNIAQFTIYTVTQNTEFFNVKVRDPYTLNSFDFKTLKSCGW
jgi:hypothetical protein